MKKWQISKIKIVHWCLDFCKESYNTTLRSVISSFKICLQNYGQFKVARYSFSGSIPPKFEHKLPRHKQSFGKIATTVVLDEDGNLL